jgi:micrococcal nuclease
MRAWLIFTVLLVFLSGCTHTGKLVAEQSDCDKEIAELDEIIEANRGRLFSVESVSDGDTITLEGGEKVRLIGINAPEKGLKYSDNATELTKELVKEGVYLARDVEDKDRYDRLLRYVFAEGKFVNAELVREGLATKYTVNENEIFTELLECLEIEAKENKKGVWSSLASYPLVMEVEYDAEGHDDQNLNGEFVAIANTGSDEIDLDGWYVKDEATHFYYFKAVSIGRGESLRLYTGQGTDTESELFWNSPLPVWNNAGDTAFLFDSNGDLAAVISFP